MNKVLQWIAGIVVIGLLSFWEFGIYVFESIGIGVSFQSYEEWYPDMKEAA